MSNPETHRKWLLDAYKHAIARSNPKNLFEQSNTWSNFEEMRCKSTSERHTQQQIDQTNTIKNYQKEDSK